MGNVGQADYSSANAFMDAFARYRNSLLYSKKRTGQTLSINWPLWKEGGMGVDTAPEMRDGTNLMAMETTSGIEVFYQGLDSKESQVVVMEEELRKLHREAELPDQAIHFFSKDVRYILSGPRFALKPNFFLLNRFLQEI